MQLNSVTTRSFTIFFLCKFYHVLFCNLSDYHPKITKSKNVKALVETDLIIYVFKLISKSKQICQKKYWIHLR